MKLVTANVGREKSARFRAAAVMDLAARAGDNSLVLWQEIDEGDTGNELAAVRKAFPNHKVANAGKREPTSVPPGWRIVGEKVIRVHGGKAHVSFDRYVCTTQVQGSEAWQKLVLISVHPVNGAFTNPGQLAEVWRREKWHEYYETVVAEIVRQVDVRGITVVVAGDWNNPHLPKLHTRERRLVHKGLDYISVIEPVSGGVHVDVRGLSSVRLGIDGHAAQVADVRLTQAASRPASPHAGQWQGELPQHAKDDLKAARGRAKSATKRREITRILKSIRATLPWFKHKKR